MKISTIRWILPLVAILALTSCEKFGQTKEQKLDGMWTYTKVRRTTNGVLSSNVTSDFLVSSIKFNADGTLSSYDEPTGTVSRGTYYLQTFEAGTADCPKEQTDIMVTMPSADSTLTDQYRTLCDLEFCGKKITFKEETPNGVYSYTLTRVGS